MHKFIINTFALFLSFFVYSQNNKLSISGKVINNNKETPVESATIYITKVKDSSVVEYTITDKQGNFSIKSTKITEPVFLKISSIGFEDFKLFFDKLLENKLVGVIKLKEASKMLDAVVIKSEIPPIRIKKDTLEFNAASFKVRPDANVEALIKQLPGVEIDTEGKITVNGKEVNQILVNGKPFFDKDGKIALQNLPSNIINKVQITDTKTKKEEKTGALAASNNASINLTIDEKKNKGFFGKAMIGHGLDKQYESSGLLNYFKNKTKISALASSNNINSVGFSMDEIFDNMGGGRNYSVWTNNDGSFGINGRRYGGNTGITQSELVGINYSDEYGKKAELSMSYYHSGAHTHNNNKTNQTNFLSDGVFATNSLENTNNDSFANSINAMSEIKIDTLTSIVVEPKINQSHNKLHNESSQKSFNNVGLLNQSNSQSNSQNDNLQFTNTLTFTKKARNKKGRFFNATLHTEIGNDQTKNYAISTTNFYQNSTPSDTRNQFIKTNYNDKANELSFEFLEPILDSLEIKLGTNLSFSNKDSYRDAYNYDATTNLYSNKSDVLTNKYESFTKTVTPFVGINLNKKKYSFNAELGTKIIAFQNSSNYLAMQSNLNTSYIVPSMNVNGSIKFSKKENIWLSYDYKVSTPSANQVLPVEDVSNPLNTFVGNPSLQLNKTHGVYLSYRNYDYEKKSGYGFYSGGNFNDSQVVSTSLYDANRKRTTTFANVSGTNNSWFGIYINKSIKNQKAKYRFNINVNNNMANNKGFTNSQLYKSLSYTISPRMGFVYELGELLTINTSYQYTKNFINYTNYSIDKTSNFIHKINIQTTNYWPKNWIFGNDFGYNYSSNIGNGFKKDFYLWNTSLSYSFFEKKFMAKVKVYDLLNQNQSTSRQISSTAITDQENTVLKRYVMFSLTYKLEKFGAKEKKSNNHQFM